MTVPLGAMRKRRIGWASELNPGYFADSVRILRAAEPELGAPTLFDLLSEEKDAA